MLIKKNEFMKISYNWLKQYVAVDLSPEDAGKILTDTGLEVEGIHKIEAVKGGLAGVVVGEVLTCEQHPDADRLKVTTVSIGTETLQIVCGAPNVDVGQKVIVATEGCTLYPSPEEVFKIKKSKIRGVESCGMLCAEDELGLGKGHDGILVLDDSIPNGTTAAQYFELEDDYEIEIGLTPNRADAMGHIGVARDLVAYLNVHNSAGLKLNIPSVDVFKVQNNDLKIDVSVEGIKVGDKLRVRPGEKIPVDGKIISGHPRFDPTGSGNHRARGGLAISGHCSGIAALQKTRATNCH